MRLSAEIHGIDEAIAKLDKAGVQVSVRFLRSALRFASKPAIERAKQLVPVDTSDGADDYSLKDTIGVRAERKKDRAGNATSMRFGAHRETNADGVYKIKGGLNKGVKAPNYASLVEDKTPFLVPAIEQTTPEILKRFGSKVNQLVKKL